MSKNRQEKKSLIDKYTELLADNPNYILVNTNGASMTHISELKTSLAHSNGIFFVVKNTLFRIAAENTQQPTIVQELSDATGVIVCGDDPTAAAKALKEIQKIHDVMDTRCAVLFGEPADAAHVNTLAEIPPREVLLAKVIGSINSPLTGFAHVLTGTVRDLVYTLSSIQESKNTT